MAEARVPDVHAPGRLRLTLLESGIAWIHMLPGVDGLAAPITLATLRELEERLTHLESLAHEGRAQAIILATSPPHLPPGSDALELAVLRREEEVVAWSHEAQRILRLLETLPVPTVAAIREDWIGGAAELALACSYRVGCVGSGARIGFPQTAAGFLPAWGGSVRLPRIVGLAAALDLVLSGEAVPLEEADRLGLVDTLLPADDFAARVEAFARDRLAHGRTHPFRDLPRRLLHHTRTGRRLESVLANRRHLGASQQEPARSVRELMTRTLALPLELALAHESSVAGQLVQLEEVRSRLHAHQSITALSTDYAPGGSAPVAAAVLGAGPTGSDLAYLLAKAGMDVRLRDPSRIAVHRGVERTRARLRWEVEHGRIGEGEASELASRLVGATGFGGFGTLDLVIATADAGRPVRELLVEVEPHVRANCVLAYHDWCASPTRVQCGLRQPERVVGIVPVLPLEHSRVLEIVPGARTESDPVSEVRRLAQRLSAVGIVVADALPTPCTRLLAVYFAEASRLLDEGATVDQVDAALQEFGFRVGPFHRMDAIGGKRVLDLLDGCREGLRERAAAGQLLRRFASSGLTFYRYRKGRPARPHPELPPGLSPGNPSVAALVRSRVLLALINEAVRIVEERVVSRVGDVDAIGVLGLGFPAHRGGLLHHAEVLGLAAVVTDLEAAARRHGARYEPARLLRSLVESGATSFEGRTISPLDSPWGG